VRRGAIAVRCGGYPKIVPAPLPNALADRLESTAALDPPARTVGKAVREIVPRGPVKDALSGTWLGHPLHPLLTDIPIGSWTSAVLLDLLGGRASEPAARRLIAIGLAAVPATAFTGWHDWADTEPASDEVRRSGFVHGLLNGTAAAVFAASLAARRNGSTGRGKLLGLAGLSLVGVGGWLGGHLAYARGVGVDTTIFEQAATEGWEPAGVGEDDLEEGRPRCVVVGDRPVLLLRQGGRVHALADRCNHRGGPLHEGEVGDGAITCPLHGSRFRLDDGSVEQGPATYPQPVFETRVTAGRIEVRRPD
jgi:nitrite reductase/ring-hydroxylating ferredoxin subunit/uncharacterized membrane protein